MAVSMFPDSLFQDVKATLMKEYRQGITITTEAGAEHRAIKATEQVLATLGRHYEKAMEEGDGDEVN